MPKEGTLGVLDALLAHGLRKITFVGGEPTLCPWLPELIRHAKQQNVSTMVVTNGQTLLEGWLDKVEGLD